MDEVRCIICESNFRPDSMKEGKCSVCAKLYPNAKRREDIKPKSANTPKTLTDETVKDIIYEVLEEAGLKRIKCEKCGKLVFRNSPAQKICLVCRDKEAK